MDTPDGVYCKLPQDSPIVVRGARNSPCMGVPGKRAPTVQECYSDKPYMPLAMRQHALGPYPMDPNLIAQGIPPDDRVDANERLYAPVEGTPLPPGAMPSGTPPDAPPPDAPPPPPPAGAPPPPPPAEVFPPMDTGGGVSATPSAFDANKSGPGPSVALAHYDPQTGQYATPDGQVNRQTDLVAAPKSWQDLIFKADE